MLRMISVRRIAARWLLLAAICFGSLAATEALAQDPRATAAQAAARAWLELTDSGDAEASWAASGKKFQSAINAAGWREALAKARAPFGKAVSRTAAGTRFDTKFPNGPDGEYALIVFDTTFEHATGAHESVTLEREADGTWRVIGYLIR
jgi:hypothetical protein